MREENNNKQQIDDTENSGLKNTPKLNKKGKKSTLQEIMEWVWCILIAVAVAFVLNTFVLKTAAVQGDSMLNTLHNNERLVTWKLGYSPKANDIIIFEPPTSTAKDRKYYVKRVIATEHQTVEIDYIENAVYVDGVKLNETYINPETDCPDSNYGMHMNDPMVDNGTEKRFVVPEDHVFVMGDNRNHSLDSRSPSVGYVPVNKIEGKVILRFWPLNKFGTVK